MVDVCNDEHYDNDSFTFILTRYLYPYDEVVITLITELLQKTDLHICYYWLYEIYYSGFDLFPLIWKIYYDFYYELNPHFESYIKKKQSLWEKNGNMKYSAYILRNLFVMKSSSTVFMLRQLANITKVPTRLYIGIQKIKWLSKYPPAYHNLLLSIKKNNNNNICYYLNLLIKKNFSPLTIFETLISFFNLNDSPLSLPSSFHQLLAFIVLFTKKTDIKHTCNKKTIQKYIVPTTHDLDEIDEINNTPIALTKHKTPQIYNTLKFKRFNLAINPLISSFHLIRWSYPHFSHSETELKNNNKFKLDNWFHWEYYAMGSPLWKKRLEQFNGTIDHKQRKIVFKEDIDNDNNINEELFYEEYGYELDEQPKDIQNLSHQDLEKKSWKDWYFNVFENSSSLDSQLQSLPFENDFMFSY